MFHWDQRWEVVIGLEVHTQLKTQSKIFSGSSIAYGAEPNTQASTVDLALPGVLPVMNKEAALLAVKFGLAIDAEINLTNIFARKNYFYPDLPKGYQISQMALPIVGFGTIDIDSPDGSLTPSDSYLAVDLTAYYQITENVRLRGGVTNFLDEEYVTWASARRGQGHGFTNIDRSFFTSPGRSFFVSVDLAF